jgi:pimeloyl-ACP methyl ester carboxylesterase
LKPRRPWHRGGAGEALLLLHGFMDSWRTWELVLPALERNHDVLALTLPGHAGGPPLPRVIDDSVMPDAVERAMDAAGFPTHRRQLARRLRRAAARCARTGPFGGRAGARRRVGGG